MKGKISMLLKVVDGGRVQEVDRAEIMLEGALQQSQNIFISGHGLWRWLVKLRCLTLGEEKDGSARLVEIKGDHRQNGEAKIHYVSILSI